MPVSPGIRLSAHGHGRAFMFVSCHGPGKTILAALPGRLEEKCLEHLAALGSLPPALSQEPGPTLRMDPSCLGGGQGREA